MEQLLSWTEKYLINEKIPIFMVEKAIYLREEQGAIERLMKNVHQLWTKSES
jgi:hypothetical protein